MTYKKEFKVVKIRWNRRVRVCCVDYYENHFETEIMAKEKMDVDNISTILKDVDNGSLVSIYTLDKVSITANSSWFDIIS